VPLAMKSAEATGRVRARPFQGAGRQFVANLVSLVSWHDAGFAQAENVSLSVSPQLPEIDLTGRSANDISCKTDFKLIARRRSGHLAGADLLRIERMLHCASDGTREDKGTLARERDEAPLACAAAARHPLPPAARSSELMRLPLTRWLRRAWRSKVPAHILRSRRWIAGHS
jgi:hypothetical protein